MRVFREDPYKIYGAVCGVAGFATTSLLLMLLVQKLTFNVQDWVILLGFSIALPASFMAGYRWAYLAVDGDDLLVAHIFWKQRIPMRCVRFLSYEFRGRDLMLFINYDIDGEIKWAKFGVDYMSTANIKALHDDLLAANQSIEFRTDSWSADAQRRNEKHIHQIPSTRDEWMKFALKWFCVGAVCQLILFLAFVPKH